MFIHQFCRMVYQELSHPLFHVVIHLLVRRVTRCVVHALCRLLGRPFGRLLNRQLIHGMYQINRLLVRLLNRPRLTRRAKTRIKERTRKWLCGRLKILPVMPDYISQIYLKISYNSVRICQFFRRAVTET